MKVPFEGVTPKNYKPRCFYEGPSLQIEKQKYYERNHMVLDSISGEASKSNSWQEFN